MADVSGLAAETEKVVIADEGEDSDGYGHAHDHSVAPPPKRECADGGVEKEPWVALAGQALIDWMRGKLQSLPAAKRYPTTTNRVEAIMSRWVSEECFSSVVWARFLKRERIIKEFNECAPVIEAVLEKVAQLPPKSNATLIELCSGFGFLGMFLSELLPPGAVEKIILVDRRWPEMSQEEPLPHQQSWTHIRQRHGTGWPITLRTHKCDLKSAAARRKIGEYIVKRSQGPVLMTAVHLCGTLSIKAIELYHAQPKIARLILKPCCLPGKIHVYQKAEWRLGAHSFTARKMYPPKWIKTGERPLHGGQLFDLWCSHLTKGLLTTPIADAADGSNGNPGVHGAGSDGAFGGARLVLDGELLESYGNDVESVVSTRIMVQAKHFQNTFIIADHIGISAPLADPTPIS